jgi:LysM repeat protein
VIAITGTDDSAGKTYKVQPGDTIFKIAKKLNMGNDGPAKLMAMNKDRVKDVTALKIGQEILVPADDTAKVVPAKADVSKSGLAADLPKPAVVSKPAADVPALSPGGKSVLAIVEKPADDKRVLTATNIKGDDMKAVAPADKTDKTAKSTALDKLDDKLNSKADPAVAGKTYTVRKGDNLYSIANDQMGSRTKSAVQKLMQVNGIKDPSKLVAGAELKIPKA